jgi:hypothetical protein
MQRRHPGGGRPAEPNRSLLRSEKLHDSLLAGQGRPIS